MDSGAGNDITLFLQQPFMRAILPLMCLLIVLLVFTVIALVYIRRRRAARTAPTAPPPAYVGADDMPDLNLLVGVPARQSAAAMPASPAASPPPAVPARVARKGTFAVSLSEGGNAEVVEVMAVLRDVVDGHLIVQMGDRAYQPGSADSDFSQRFSKVMRELSSSSSKSAAPTSPPIQTQSAPPAQPPTASTRVSPPPVTPDGRMPGDLPSFRLEDNPVQKHKRGQKSEAKPIPELDIAGAIEAYLQHKLRHTPEFAGRSIHIFPSPDGGVSIEVDGQYFDAVTSVTDPTVREFLSGAINEWQQRH